MFKYDCRYHAVSSEHKMKEDYEAIALAKAEAKGPKEVLALLHLDVLDHVLGKRDIISFRSTSTGRSWPET